MLSGLWFTGIEHENNVYDKVLNQCRKDFEPKYKEEFDKQYNLVYYTLRENVIASIHGEIKAAYRHKKEINRLLAKIKFSDSIYQRFQSILFFCLVSLISCFALYF